MEQSDQGLHCLPFHLHLLDMYVKTTLFKFTDNYSIFFRCWNFSDSYQLTLVITYMETFFFSHVLG